jgi:RimJ/RimL family protein N-acetyltransferase
VSHTSGDAIGTERLELRPLQPGDAAEMAVVLGDVRLHEFIGGSPASPDQLADSFRRLAAGSGRPDELWLNWIVRLRTTGEAIGTVQATVTRAGDRRAASVAWVVGVPWQGRGFASEAAAATVAWLDSSGATAITACVRPGHIASERVARRSGLVPTDREVDGERIWVRRSLVSSADRDQGAGEPDDRAP